MWICISLYLYKLFKANSLGVSNQQFFKSILSNHELSCNCKKYPERVYWVTCTVGKEEWPVIWEVGSLGFFLMQLFVVSRFRLSYGFEPTFCLFSFAQGCTVSPLLPPFFLIPLPFFSLPPCSGLTGSIKEEGHEGAMNGKTEGWKDW